MILEISDEVQKLTTIDMQTQNAYDELNAKCDLVLEKIKARKAERKKRLAEN